MQTYENLSLLYPPQCRKEHFLPEEQVQKDLETGALLEHMAPSCGPERDHHACLSKIFLAPSCEAGVIAYRQDIFQLLLDYPVLLEAFEKLLPLSRLLSHYRRVEDLTQPLLYNLVSRICELESYLECLEILKQALEEIDSARQGRGIPAAGLKELYAYIQETYRDKLFIHLKENLPELAASVRSIRSITIGVNLSESCRPVTATLVSCNKQPFSGATPSVFGKLFAAEESSFTGIAPLHAHYSPESGAGPHLAGLFEDLSDVMKKICLPIRRALQRYVKINTRLFTEIREDLIFYIHSTRLLKELKAAGLPVCRPEILPATDRITEIREHYNINLFIQLARKHPGEDLSARLVTNDVTLGEEGRIAILTGPNQGGKTVYTQALGLSQILFQAGLFIPGNGARLSLVDALFTHFQIEETLANATGRFADEARRLHAIIEACSEKSMILMNESFASTNYTESLYITEDIMRIFRMAGFRVVFSTHFHDLAARVEEINSQSPGRSRLFSLVSMVSEDNGLIRRTFRILPHPPQGNSYARETAARYGIGFEQLAALIDKHPA